MGQTLSEPILDKETQHGENERVIFAVSSMQGWRISMEDSHTAILSLKSDENSDNDKIEKDEKEIKLRDDLSFFAVFDGHGGGSISKYASNELHKIIVNENNFKLKKYEESLKAAFFKLDQQMQQDSKLLNSDAGSTAIVSLFSGKTLYIANCGDSRAILSSSGNPIVLSVDHKPTLPAEKTRIINSGGFLQGGRVNGNLSLSRALGDFVYKMNNTLPVEEQTITANPDIIVRDITEEDEFIVLACDGIWDVMRNDQVIDYIREGIANRLGLSKIAENLLNECISESDKSRSSSDNMTVIIVGFLQGKTKEQYYEMIKNRVKQNFPDKVFNNDDHSEIIEITSSLKKDDTSENSRDEIAALQADSASPTQMESSPEK